MKGVASVGSRGRGRLPQVLLFGLLGAMTLACKPDLVDADFQVTGARLLAVRSEPAEAAPGVKVRWKALVAGPEGTDPAAPVTFNLCNARKPLAELGPVNPLCLDLPPGDQFTDLGTGVVVEGSIPTEACQLFGSDVPPAKKGETQGRPVDADVTGGYYQPVRVGLPGANGEVTTLASSRLTCGLTGVTPEQLREFKARYSPNVNPSIDSLTVEGQPLPGGSLPARVVAAPGGTLGLRATWADCPSELPAAPGPDEPALVPSSCTGAEVYALFDVTTRQVIPKREAIRVAWYATAGRFEVERSGRASDDPTPFTENNWVAPATEGLVHLWAVIRDERGGAGWLDFEVRVAAVPG